MVHWNMYFVLPYAQNLAIEACISAAMTARLLMYVAACRSGRRRLPQSWRPCSSSFTTSDWPR